ncbi:unnamed protein product, partial [Aphanomyces euteiches]
MEKYISSTQTWNLQYGDSEERAKIEAIGTDIHQRRIRLLKAAEHLQLYLSVQVVGSIDDMQQDIGNMMMKMQSLGEHLESIEKMSDHRRQRDELAEVGIQMQPDPGLEYYDRQVPL